MTGRVADGLPRVWLDLPGLSAPIQVEFIVDTAFDGELTLPPSLIRRIEARFDAARYVMMADLSTKLRDHYEVILSWMEDLRPAEVIEVEGRPLIGTGLMQGNLVQIEMEEGGSVDIQAL